MTTTGGPPQLEPVVGDIGTVLFERAWRISERSPFVVMLGSGERSDCMLTMNAELTAEKRPAYETL